MKNTLDIGTLAQKWYQENHTEHTVNRRENSLFRMLYKAYCCCSGEEDRWEKLTTKYDFRDACGRIYRWYKHTYEIGFRMPAGQKGQKRVASAEEGKYTFHRCYSDDRSFRLYLLNDQPLSCTQTLFSFVLHTAVAFLVPPDVLDRVLQDLGFHPLHVKNIHHLAIYYVLLTSATPNGELRDNPFDKVRELYLRAQELLRAPDTAPADAYSYAGKLTWMIREKLFLQKAIGNENFENLVKLNRDALNMRHSMLLKDFNILTAVFFTVFDDVDYIPVEPPEKSEVSYSFYAFVGRYCRIIRPRKTKLKKEQTQDKRPQKKITREKYRELLSSMITVSGKYPTREMMILLWLFAYCFAYTTGIYMEPTPFDRIKRKLLKADPSRDEDSVNRFYHNDTLDVYGLIIDEKRNRDMREFRGDEIIENINEKLRLYGWKQLNSKLLFDYYIQQLEGLVLRLDHSSGFDRCKSIEYQDVRLTGIPVTVDNVPCPLVAITWIMHHIKAVHLLHPEASPIPLECGLYEQI